MQSPQSANTEAKLENHLDTLEKAAINRCDAK